MKFKYSCTIKNQQKSCHHSSILQRKYITAEKVQSKTLWRVVVTTAQLHSIKPELRFCAGSNPACGVSEIRNAEDL